MSSHPGNSDRKKLGYSQALIASLKAYRKSRSVIDEALLRQNRNVAARLLIDIASDNVHELSWGENLEATVALMKSGLRTLAPTGEEAKIIEDAQSRLLDDGAPVELQISSMIAFCLFLPPHQMEWVPDFSRIPLRLYELVVRVLFTEPEFFVAIGEADSHSRYLEKITFSIDSFVRGNAPQQNRIHLASLFTRYARFLSGYFTDRSLKAMYQARADIIEYYLEAVGVPIEFSFPPRSSERRVRVGVLRTSWLGGAETAAVFAHINGLDRSRFEIIFYAFGSKEEHPVEREARKRSDRFVTLSGKGVQEALAEIRKDDLDVMLIGTNITAIGSNNVLLSACRLARKQIALTLNPATSGFRSIDAFINGELNEPVSAQEEYTERIILIPGSINRYDFSGEPSPGNLAVQRQTLGVGDDKFLFASGANFYKLTPELIDAWAEILRKTENSVLLLYPFNPNWSDYYPSEMFVRHLNAFFRGRGVSHQRVRVLGPLPSRSHIMAILRKADLYLDSFPYSGAVSIMDPIAAGCPVLLREGRAARNCQSTGLFREKNFAGLLASTTADYIEKAVHLVSQPSELQILRNKAGKMSALPGEWTCLNLSEVLS